MSQSHALDQPCTADTHVLVVEDSCMLQALIGGTLRSHGYRTQVCGNGLEAIAAVDAAARTPWPIDIVLMDVVMPELNGVEASFRLRRQGYAGRIVMLTAADESYDMACSFMAGADDFLAKPFTPEQLEATIERNLASSSSNPLLEASTRSDAAAADPDDSRAA